MRRYDEKTSDRFLNAQVLCNEREEAHESADITPKCLCHDGMIDGVKYHFTNAGCRVHSEIGERNYISVLQSAERIVGATHHGSMKNLIAVIMLAAASVAWCQTGTLSDQSLWTYPLAQSCNQGEYLSIDGRCLHDQTGKSHPSGDGRNLIICQDPACHQTSITLAYRLKPDDPAIGRYFSIIGPNDNPLKNVTLRCDLHEDLFTVENCKIGTGHTIEEAVSIILKIHKEMQDNEKDAANAVIVLQENISFKYAQITQLKNQVAALKKQIAAEKRKTK
jgi:hypothetical protein